MKPRVLVFIPSQNEAQRFVLGGAFSRLEQQFDLTYILPESDREKLLPLMTNIAEDAKIRFIKTHPARTKVWSKLFNTACYQYSRKSRSFALRINAEKYAGEPGKKRLQEDWETFGGVRATSSIIDKILSKFKPAKVSVFPDKKNKKLRMFDKNAYESYCEKTLAELKPNAEINELFCELKPLAVIVPSSLLDVFCSDVIWSANDNNIASIVLQSGWDNLSSKGILNFLPTYMGVWGKQSRAHAVDIQGMSRSALVDLGAPHYEALVPAEEAERQKRRAALGVLPDETLILFGGSFRQFDETQALHDLDEMVETKKLKCKIFYRPHPYRLDREAEDDYFQVDWKHVVFDGEMLERYQRSKDEAGYIKRQGSTYSMANLADVISSVDVVISPMSTLLLEAMILEKPSMAIAFSDDQHTYSAATASEMTHFDELKKNDKALIWCSDRRDFISDTERLMSRKSAKAISNASMIKAQKKTIDKVVRTAPGNYADRLFDFFADTVAPDIFNKRKSNAELPSSISHYYGADKILQAYAGQENAPDVPGFWMHGWLPKYFNTHYGLIALHKKPGIPGAARISAHEAEKENEFQWVARQDQADFLTLNGYKKAHAIGNPFVYLPAVDVERKAGSLLVMPPHGRKEHFDGDFRAQNYVDAILKIKDQFSKVTICVTERDYARGEWRPAFQKAGFTVVIGANHYVAHPLLHMKKLLSSFEYVTTNAFGSHIAYAAHCGAKVSVFGPYCEWPAQKGTHASIMFPEVAPELVKLQSRDSLKSHYPFLFCEPAKADVQGEWGDREIGLDQKKSPAELKKLMGW